MRETFDGTTVASTLPIAILLYVTNITKSAEATAEVVYAIFFLDTCTLFLHANALFHLC